MQDLSALCFFSLLIGRYFFSPSNCNTGIITNNDHWEQKSKIEEKCLKMLKPKNTLMSLQVLHLPYIFSYTMDSLQCKWFLQSIFRAVSFILHELFALYTSFKTPLHVSFHWLNYFKAVPQEIKTENRTILKVEIKWTFVSAEKDFRNKYPLKEHNIYKRKADNLMVKELQQIPIFAA